jgi:hypothetical protein
MGGSCSPSPPTGALQWKARMPRQQDESMQGALTHSACLHNWHHAMTVPACTTGTTLQLATQLQMSSYNVAQACTDVGGTAHACERAPCVCSGTTCLHVCVASRAAVQNMHVCVASRAAVQNMHVCVASRAAVHSMHVCVASRAAVQNMHVCVASRAAVHRVHLCSMLCQVASLQHGPCRRLHQPCE